MSAPDSNDFAKAAEGPRRTLGREIVDMLRENKKWWLIPIIAVLLLIGAVIILGATHAAPFIYTLF